MKPPPAERPTSQASRSLAGRAGRVEQKWWVLVAIGISTFMSALDISVVNTVLPVVNDSFKSQVDLIEWVVIIYLLVVSGLLLSFGRLGDMRGHRVVFLWGFLGFILSSMLCGLAQSPQALIAFRGLQALGAAMLSANSPAILTKSFPDHQRGQALGMQATMTYLGLTVGPSLGGWLTEQISWRAVFFINLPVGLLAFLLSWRFVPHDGGSQTKEHFDLAGALSFMAGLIALLLGLNQGSAWGWRSLPISSLLVAAMILLIVFVRIELKAKNPMLDLTLFRHRVFSASVVSAVFNYICVYSILFLMPFYLIQGRQLNAAQAGLVLTAMPIVMAVVAPLSGYLSDRIGARIPSTLGMLCLAGGLFMLSRLDPGSSTLEMIEALGISGLGIGTFISPNNSALMGSAPRRRQGIAAGMMATARNVGMVLGVGLAGAVYTTVLAQHAQSAATSLFEAVQASFLTAIVVAVLGAIASSIGGQRAKASEPLEPQHT